MAWAASGKTVPAGAPSNGHGVVGQIRESMKRWGHEPELVTATRVCPPAPSTHGWFLQVLPLSCWCTGIVTGSGKAFHFGKNGSLALLCKAMAGNELQHHPQ